MVDVPEYEDDGAAEAVVGEAPSSGSKDSANDAVGESKSVLNVRCAGEGGGAVKFVLAGLGGDARTSLLCFASDDEERGGACKTSDGFVGAGAEAGSPLSWAFRHGVDVPQISQRRRMYPLTE